ncbi:MAG: hypothetical protein JRD68_01005 [Deltaproteobacteria bacterium]|nr:hypothetical protein [Deltaproteobacteria bacterium]
MKVFLLALFVVLIASGASGEYVPRVVVSHDGNEERLARNLTQKAEGILSRLEEKFGLELSSRVEIILASDRASFRRAQIGKTKIPDWAVGAAYPELNRILLLSPRALPGHDITQVLTHELAHLVLGRIFQQKRVPVWLNEALTMHLAWEWGLSRRAALTRAIMAGRLIPLHTLVRSFPKDTIGAETAYAESFYFISFLKNRYGRSSVERLIRNLGLGVSLENALLQASGLSMEELEEEFFRWVKFRFSFLAILTGSGTIWFLAALLLVMAWIRKKATTARILAAWEEEAERKDPSVRMESDGPGSNGNTNL